MSYVTDTHSLIWHVTNDPKLSARARGVFRNADQGKEYIHIPCIIFFELLYLVERNKSEVDFDGFITDFSCASNYGIEPICLPIIEMCRNIPREMIKDPWDRLIGDYNILKGRIWSLVLLTTFFAPYITNKFL